MQIRKVASAGLGALMAGMTLAAPALAADLTDFPTPFVSGSSADFVVVVGAGAQPTDVLAAADITATLGGLTTSSTTTTTSGGDTVAQDISLGGAINDGGEENSGFTGPMTDTDLNFLADGTLSFDGKTWNVHEEITLDSASPSIETSISGSEDDYGSDVYMEVTRGSLGYKYVFDENINLTDRIDSDTPLEIEFLGRSLTVTSVTDADTWTVEVGEKHTLGTSDSVTVEGKVVRLVQTGASDALVSVDGVEGAVSTGSTKTINGLRVKVDSIFNDDGTEFDKAIVIVGIKAEETVDNNDAYVGEDENDPRWLWNLGGLNTNTPTIGVDNDFVLQNENGDTSTDPDTPAVTVGGSIEFPHSFAAVNFESLKGDDYVRTTVDFDNSIDVDGADINALTWGASEDGFVLTTDKDETITLDFDGTGWSTAQITADVETDTLYFVVSNASRTVANASVVDVFYVDADNDPTYAGNLTANVSSVVNFGWINYGDTTGASRIELGYNGTINGTANDAGNAFDLVFQDEHVVTGGTEDIFVRLGVDDTTTPTFDALGDTASTEEAAELRVGTTNLGTKDEDHRTQYGIIVYDPKSNGASDNVVLDIPTDAVEAVISIGKGTSVTSTSVSGQITTSVSKLDTEVVAASETNMIIVGGPCVNDLVAQLAEDGDYPWTCESFPAAGSYGLHFIEDAFATDQAVLVVAGQTAADTRAAAGVLQNYATEGFTGASHTVVVSDESEETDETA